jgi:hypothetical protein
MSAPAIHLGASLTAPALCGKIPQHASEDPAMVSCKNCLRRHTADLNLHRAPGTPRMPKPIELVEFVATFHDNPNIDACPECLPRVAEILDANPDKEPAELDLPPCDFCDGLRLVYVQRAAETSP